MDYDTAGLYIHIPFCKSKCSYCDFFSLSQKENLIEDYINALCKEISWKIKIYSLKIDTVFIGGGTPSIIPLELLKKLSDHIFSLISPKEFTIEANPDDISESFLKTCIRSNISRISLGIQSLCEKSLNTCHRRSDSKTCLNSLTLIKELWESSERTFSLDLISGLPYETEETFLQGLKNILTFSPPHISLYDLMLEEGTKLYYSYKNYNADKTAELWLKGRNFLIENGYTQYEVSNFSKKGKECLHNLKYWTAQNYIGCGAGATESLYKKKGTFKGRRKSNCCNIEKYISFWKDKSLHSDSLKKENEKDFKKTLEKDICKTEFLDTNTCKFEFFMMGLRLKKGVSEEEYFKRFDQPFPQKIKDCFFEWKKKNLAELSIENKWINFSLNEDGMLFLNRLLEQIS